MTAITALHRRNPRGSGATSESSTIGGRVRGSEGSDLSTGRSLFQLTDAPYKGERSEPSWVTLGKVSEPAR